MVLRFVIVCWMVLCAAPAAMAMDRVTTQNAFLQTLAGKELTLRIYGLRINVQPSGSIVGKAVGYEITGDWAWRDGYFCREMDWSGYPIDYNCQLVEADGNRVRFTSDKGAGDSAVFVLRN